MARLPGCDVRYIFFEGMEKNYFFLHLRVLIRGEYLHIYSSC